MSSNIPPPDPSPVSADNCTINGYRAKATSAAWIGLDLARAEILRQSTLMLCVFGKDAPYDLHLNVPWMHPEDREKHADNPDSWCYYRVRPKRKRGARFFRAEDGMWMLAYG